MPRSRPCIGWTSCALVASLGLAGCAATLDQDAALAAVPFGLLADGRVVVDVLVNGEGPFRFAVDTAATGSFVLPRVRDSLGLETLDGETATVFGAVARGEYPIVEVARLTVGDETWARARLIALAAGTSATADVDGVLGTDFLRRYSVGFDSRNRVLRLYRPATIAGRSYSRWSSITLRGESIGLAAQPLHFLDFEVEGRAVPALFDLGAGISILNTPAARALRLEPSQAERKGEFAGALGSEPVIAHLDRQDVVTGRVRWRDESFLIADPEIFATLGYSDRPLGILGSGLFTQRDFIIDFARDRLLIRWPMTEYETGPAGDE